MIRTTLDKLPISSATREALLRDGIDGAVVWQDRKDATMVSAFGPGCQSGTEELMLDAVRRLLGVVTHVWNRSVLPDPVAPGSKTAQALALLDNDPKLTPYGAAKRLGINPSAVYRALERRDTRGVCKCCGRPL